jgi:diguanylate cyclase (GGDEF)-like protein
MSSNSVLIVDDDAMFRAFVSELLHSRGLNVIEARSGREATAKISTFNPILALVDYRLPEIDGLTWITQMREMGKNFPIVFISASWCDQKTFARLRNLLKVSLILQKPIVPELFIQQIESLLPASHLLRNNQLAATEQAVDTQMVSANQNTWADEIPSFEEQKKLRSQDEHRQHIAAAQAKFSAELTDKWAELSHAVLVARENIDDRIALNEAVMMAHKLLGTAGSVGFKRTGDAAGKVEALLNRLDPTDTLQEVIWTEIFRFLAEGEIALRETAQPNLKAGSSDQIQNVTSKKILLWGTEEQYKPLTMGLNTFYPVDIDICESLAGLMLKAKRNKYHAAIFDLSMDDPKRMFAAAAELREFPQHRALPLACIVSPTAKLAPKDIVYAGFSFVLANNITSNGLAETCNDLLRSGLTHSARILTVDDDEVLTQFISTILTAEDMTVRTLNKPIMIMDVVEEFKPDLVLLDVMMPGLSGYDVCRMLLADEKWRDLAIVFLTSKSDQAGRAAAFQAGGDDFLAKPVLAQELISRVSAQVNQARRRRGLLETDQATGALSGPEFLKEADKLLVTALNMSVPLSVCLLGVDEYSYISITHGMSAAKEAAVTLGKLIHQHFRAEDLRGKIGEEVFAMAFLNEDQNTIGKAMEQLLAEYGELKIASDGRGTLKSTFSAGVAQYPRDGTSLHLLLNAAHQRLLSGRQYKLGAISYAGAPI